MCSCQWCEVFCTADRLRICNFVTYGLILLGIIIRFFVSDEKDDGIGDTPSFLFVSQAILTFLFVALLIAGELHKPAAIMMCFPLLMSRTGRGVIIVMLSLPLTNFLEAYTAILMIITTTVGVINISLGCKDGPIELKYAEEGVPERSYNTPSMAPPA